MVIIRNEEIRDMSLEEMDEKLTELRNELLRERSIVAAGGASENPGRIKEIRRTIARMKTIKAEKGVKV
ncbi:MAG: 50S ribosomal protein L29 [Candidatus Hydrothermarchaeales archaeon]